MQHGRVRSFLSKETAGPSWGPRLWAYREKQIAIVRDSKAKNGGAAMAAN